MANIKFVPVSRGLKGILDYVTNREKTVDRLDFDTAQKIVLKLAVRAWRESVVVVATHSVVAHIHSHFVVNAVCFETRAKRCS